jgi:hypothetical protein
LPSQALPLPALWWGEFRLAHWQPCLPLPHLPTNSNRIGMYLVFFHGDPSTPTRSVPPSGLAVFEWRPRACWHQCMLAGAEGAAADVPPRFTFLGVLRSMFYPPLASARVISHVFNLQAGWRLAGRHRRGCHTPTPTGSSLMLIRAAVDMISMPAHITCMKVWHHPL